MFMKIYANSRSDTVFFVQIDFYVYLCSVVYGSINDDNK